MEEVSLVMSGRHHEVLGRFDSAEYGHLGKGQTCYCAFHGGET